MGRGKASGWQDGLSEKRLRKSDPRPEGHRALQTRDYIDQIEKIQPITRITLL